MRAGRALFSAGGLALLVSLLAACQSQLVFLPHVPGRDLRATPQTVGLAYEELQLRTKDGESLHAWYVPAEDARFTVLHFHGNAGNIGDRVDLLQMLHAAGASVLMIEYRGYGQSTGRPSETGVYRDAMAGWRYLVDERGQPAARIVLHGQSLGGAVAAQLASQVAPAGLVLESTFTSLPEVAAELYPAFLVRLFLRMDFDTRKRLAEINAPLLIVHSRDDEIVPFSHAEALQAAAGEDARLVALSGDHNTGIYLNAQRYVEAMRDFLDSLPPPNPASD